MAQTIGKLRDFDEKINPISRATNKQIRGAGLSPIQGTIDSAKDQDLQLAKQEKSFKERRAAAASANKQTMASSSLLTKKV